MIEQAWWVVSPLVGYLIGSVPFAWLIGVACGVDLRRVGSRNVGAGNLYRTAGLPAGVVAALLDGLKGLIPTVVADRLGAGPAVASITGLAAVAGHNWSIYLRGRSGRGLATSAGVLAAVSPSLLVWTAGWSVAGWKLGGGIGGFVGWVALPVVAVLLGRPAPVVLAVFGLAILMLIRRMQGGADRAGGMAAAFRRAVFDRDTEDAGDAASEPAQ